MVIRINRRNFMNLLATFISAVTFLFSFSGCSFYPHQAWLEDDSHNKIADKRSEAIITALENKDNDSIKLMFSKQAIDESENLDRNIEHVIKHYQGFIKSSDGTISSEDNVNGKEKKVTIKGDYTVITDIETYNLFFIEKSNTENEDENGLYMFWISKESEKGKYQGNYGAGVYFPEGN